MGKKKLPDLQIKELLMVKAGDDWTRTFMATIERYPHEDGSNFVVGKVVVKNYQVVGQALDEDELLKLLDKMGTLILDYNLHKTIPKTSTVAGTIFYMN